MRVMAAHMVFTERLKLGVLKPFKYGLILLMSGSRVSTVSIHVRNQTEHHRVELVQVGCLPSTLLLVPLWVIVGD